MTSRTLATEVAGFSGNNSTDHDSFGRDASDWAVIGHPTAHQVVDRSMFEVDQITGHFLNLEVAHDMAIGAMHMDALTTAWLTGLDQHENRNGGHHGSIESSDHHPGDNHGHEHGGGHGGGHM